MSKRRGVKVYGGQPVNAGGIIIRQLGTKVGEAPGGPLPADARLQRGRCRHCGHVRMFSGGYRLSPGWSAACWKAWLMGLAALAAKAAG